MGAGADACLPGQVTPRERGGGGPGGAKLAARVAGEGPPAEIETTYRFRQIRGGGRGGEPVGTATVYRTLDLLVQSGLVAERDFGEGFKRYEAVPPGQTHEHCVCSSCGKVFEFSNDRLERMIGLLAEEVAFRPHHHRLEVFGLCRECQQANPLTHTRRPSCST